MTMQSYGRYAMILALMLPLSACAAEGMEQNGTESTETTESASSSLAVTPLSGLNCGLGYKNGDFRVGGECQGRSTLDNEAADGFHIANDGDLGASPNNGFYHQALTFGDIQQPGAASLPAGTACGFKHTCNSSRNETCMGFDPAKGQCPRGWTAKSASDDS